MTGPINKPESFSYQQMNKIVEAYEGKVNKSIYKQKSAPQEASDKVDLGKKPAEMDVIILPGKNIMKSEKGLDARKMAKKLTEKGVKVDEKLDVISGVTAKVDPESAAKLKEEGYLIYDNSVRNLLPDVPKPSIYAAEGKKPWDMPKIEDVKWTGADKLHQKGFTGKGEVVAVIDSGFSHPEKSLIAWKDVVSGTKKPNDPHGHGTHVAGDVVKMAPDADLIAVRVMRADGSGRTSDIVKGLQWAINNKEKYNIGTVNMSLGSGPDGYPYYMDPINKAVEEATRKGITVVVAAGNSGPGARTIGSPADSPQALTVGSALNPNKVSDFSSRGPTDDNMKKPDIVAPGEFITSWAVPGSQMDKIATTVETIRRMTPAQLRKLFKLRPELIRALGLPKDILSKNDKTLEKLTKISLPPFYKPTKDTLAAPGTSFASPEVAGLVAGLKQSAPDASPGEIKEALMDTADNMGPNYTVMDQGAGFVRADEAQQKLAQS